MEQAEECDDGISNTSRMPLVVFHADDKQPIKTKHIRSTESTVISFYLSSLKLKKHAALIIENF